MEKIFRYILIMCFIIHIKVKAQPGSIDINFSTGTGFTGAGQLVNAITQQSDGKILVGGNFNFYNSNFVKNMVRLNTDGSYDSTFNAGNIFNDEIRAIAVQADGKIIVGGSFTNVNNSGVDRIARLNSDGSFDNTFNPGTGFNDQVRSIIIQPNGKIVVAGWFLFVNSIWNNRIARLNSDGSTDTTFYSGNNGVNGEINTARRQVDGKIIIGGGFSTYDGTAISRLARINTDGTLDNSFSVGTGLDGQVNAIDLFADSIITVVGNFYNYNNSNSYNLVQIDKSGNIIPTFNSGTGTGGNSPYSVKVQSDGKIIIGGAFISYNGNNINHIARLNTNGTLDSTFITGTGTDAGINSLCIQSDDKVIAGGPFTNYNSNSSKGIVRINSTQTTTTLENRLPFYIQIFPSPFSSQTTLSTDNVFRNATLIIINIFGQTVKQIKNILGQSVNIFRDNLPSGLYFVQLTQDGKTFSVDKLVITDCLVLK